MATADLICASSPVRLSQFTPEETLAASLREQSETDVRQAVSVFRRMESAADPNLVVDDDVAYVEHDLRVARCW
jgi:hypothetical protein